MPETAKTTLSSFLNQIQFQTHLNILFSHLSAFSTFIFTQFNSILPPFTAPISHFLRTQFIKSSNQTIALIIPILINFLQLKKTDPFSTHPKTMCLAVSTTLVFYVAHIALLRYNLRRRFAIIAGHFHLSVGNASVASLASVLLPDSFSPFVFTLFGLLSAAELVYWLYDALVAEDDRRMRVFLDNVWTAFTNFTWRRRQSLPV